ncbi:hypothetical protein DB32_000559 [Sandaracinus amylolyticus]|uniref:Uncharacterized protein n=1 Tax=Sandaracinus amylolyticus TaxID=927083 RepID=A0A0F6YGY8_9BACT|nr:hypothetical protein DB32_000559 [Sandaracinus amylolyticus]
MVSIFENERGFVDENGYRVFLELVQAKAVNFTDPKRRSSVTAY